MTLIRVIVIVCAITAIMCDSENNNDHDEVIRYLQRYGYLGDTSQMSSDEEMTTLKYAISLFQEFYQLPGDGTLNNITLHMMRKPRCGLVDIPHQKFDAISQKWPKTHLTWNFHLTDKNVLKTTEAAFALWEANSSLIFERNVLRPDILISFRKGIHTYVNNRNNINICSSTLDGPGGVLAHAYFPNGEIDYISEIHVDETESWHIHLDENPPNKLNLLQTLTHEIGHSLGLTHSPRKDSVMFPFAPDKPFPIKLSIEDILAIQHLYGVNDKSSKSIPSTTTMRIKPIPTIMTTPATTTTTTTTTMTTTTNMPNNYQDLCDLHYVDVILILDHRIFIAHRRHIWSININGKTYDKPLLLTDYMNFLPKNFTRLSAAYQRPSGDIVFFLNGMIYMIEYPSFTLKSGWPKTLATIRLPANAKINAAINTNKGRTFVIYNDHNVAEINECTMTTIKFSSLQATFPGIPFAVTSAFRYIDGNLYFISNQHYYRFNEFVRSVTAAGEFNLQIVDIECPREGLLRQLRDLLNRIIQFSGVFTNDPITRENDERETEN